MTILVSAISCFLISLSNVYADKELLFHSIPKELMGVWDVTHVGVDVRDQAHWLYFEDDPRLLGRELQISNGNLKFNDGSLDCEKPKWNKKSISWKDLIGTSFRRPDSFAIPAHPSPSDFGFSKPVAQIVDVYFPDCEKGNNGRVPAPWNESWFAYDGKELVMRISTTALLLLKKRLESEAPKPSFDCGKSQSLTEKEICKSVALSAFDRSVLLAWRLATKKNQNNMESLRREQTQWLKERDSCADNAACIHDKMLERVEMLMQE